MKKQDVVESLVIKGAPKDRATIYADAFLEYREACENIEKYGIIVSHPRTANPIENPYLSIRDRASKKMLSMRLIQADHLW